MNTLLPTVYLLILFLSLCTLLVFLFTQILRKKEIETELSELQKKSRSGNSTPSDQYSLGVIYLSKKLFDQAILQFSNALKNWSGNRSKEMGDTNKNAPVAKIKKNKYGV